jgi:hypothetical protein
MIELIFGILILGAVVFIAFKVLHNVVIGIALILLIFMSSYLILGSVPNLKSVPLIGNFLPSVPNTSGDAVAAIKNILHNVEILSVTRDSQNNLLVTVSNTGKGEVSNFKFFVDNSSTKILNNPRDPLKSGDVTVFQLHWKVNYVNIILNSDQVNATYEQL